MNGNYHRRIIFLDLVAKAYFFIFGWKIIGKLPEKQKKYVIIIAHHTSNWDFPIVLATKFLLRVHASWFAKEGMFFWPTGWLLKRFGGIPIVRSRAQKVVDLAIEQFKQREYFILGLAPEGTREKVEKFKTGFYRIAKGAQVPILPVGLDYETKSLVIYDLVFTTDNESKDMEHLYGLFKLVKAKFPEKACDRCKR